MNLPQPASDQSHDSARVADLGTREYESVWRAMQQYTDQRTAQSDDWLWIVAHPPVFTQGLAGKAEHLLHPGAIPVVQTDRGGQVTYHGPGQLVVYTLIDLRRRRLGIRDMVHRLEQTLIALLAGYGIPASARPDAPGVYVAGRKIGSLGLRVRQGCSYHGISLNVDMDLEPFTRINPCGYPDLHMTQLRDLGGPSDLQAVAADFAAHFGHQFGYAAMQPSASPLPFEQGISL